MKTYLVGGAVRDKLLGLEPSERDWVVVGSTVDEMLALGYQQVGKDFPVFLHPDTHEEYALARSERKTAPGYTGFEFNTSSEVSLEQDLSRRDLTINAIAEDTDGSIIDPYHGQEDLENGLLRHVSPAFAEDPVRILRTARFAARFAQWGFRVAHGTHALMKKMVASGEVDSLVAERVWAETLKALSTERPERYFEVLRACGALQKIFPELDQCFGVPQPENHHPEVDTGIHIMMVLHEAAKLSDNTRVRFAALTHDLGKGTTRADILPHHYGHEERSVNLLKNLCERIKVPSQYRDLAILTARYHTHCHRLLELKPQTILKTLKGLDAFRRPQRFEEFLVACHADARGRLGHELDDYPQADYFRRCLQACLEVKNEELTQRGLKGKAFADALWQERIKQIKLIQRPD